MRTRANPIYCGVDTIDLAQATKLIQSIAGGPKPAVGGIKLGLEFFLAHGAPGVRYAFPTPVRATGVGFFLDLKLHDIPNTVAGGIRAVIDLAPTFITIHASGGRDMLKAAVEEAANQAAKLNVPRPKLLGVTVLTSLDRADLEATGVNADPSDQVLRLGALARDSGLACAQVLLIRDGRLVRESSFPLEGSQGDTDAALLSVFVTAHARAAIERLREDLSRGPARRGRTPRRRPDWLPRCRCDRVSHA